MGLLQRVELAAAGLALALVIGACSQAAATPTVPDVAGTYLGEVTVVTEGGGTSAVFPNVRAVVAQDGSDIEISISLVLPGTEIAALQPLAGTIDASGTLSIAESSAAIELGSVGGCGDPTPTDLSGSFTDDQFRLSTTATTETCGTVTTTLIAKKT